MTTQNKNVPALRFPEFNGHWEVKKLGDITKINQGLQIPISERYSEQVENSFFYITNEFLREGSQKKYFIKNPPKSVLCGKDDLLMTRTGNTGKVVTGVEGAFHNNFFKVKYDDERCNKSFLYYFLTSHKIQHNILILAGTSTIPDLNHGDFYRIKIPLPSLLEQQKIAAFLTVVDAKIQQLTKKKALLEQYKKGVMQQFFNQEIRFKDDNGNDFADWEEKKISEVASCLDNKRVPLNQAQREKMKGSIPYWGANNVMDYINDFLFDEPLVLLAEDGGYFDEYQTRPIANFTIGKCWVNNHAHILRAKENVLTKFLYFSLVHKNILAYVNAGTRSKLNKSDMLLIKLKLPSVPEQQKIANFLSAIDDKIHLVNQKLERTQTFKKGLLQRLFV